MVVCWRADVLREGFVVQFLVVPELMPFRLTRQFVSLMEPLKEAGLIQSVMVHSLRAFRSQPELLLNTMDVFVKEPSLDWKVRAPMAGSASP